MIYTEEQTIKQDKEIYSENSSHDYIKENKPGNDVQDYQKLFIKKSSFDFNEILSKYYNLEDVGTDTKKK